MSDTLTKPENVTESAGRGDAITSGSSPRPWRVDGAFILDSAGGAIAMMCEPDYTVDAALIVDAVNERDRLREERDRLAADEARYRTHNVVLRNIVRRLADLTTNLLANYEHRYREDRNSMDFVGNARALLREARVAIGEDTPCN